MRTRSVPISVTSGSGVRVIAELRGPHRSSLTGCAASVETPPKRTQPSSANKVWRTRPATASDGTSIAARPRGRHRAQIAQRRCRWSHGKPDAQPAKGCARKSLPNAKSSEVSARSRHDSITTRGLSPPDDIGFTRPQQAARAGRLGREDR
jgi:hypothetical protein